MYGKKLKKLFIFIFFLRFSLVVNGQSELIITFDKIDKDSVCFLNWMQGARFFAVSGKNIFIADTNTKKIDNVINLSKKNISCLHFNDYESAIIFSDDDETVSKWSFRSLETTNIYSTGENFIPSCIAINPNGKLIAAGFKNGFVKVNVELKLQKAEFGVGFKLHEGEVKSIGFNYNGQYMFTAGEDNKIKILDSDSLEVFKEFDFNGKADLPVVFSPKNNSFASSAELNTVSIRNIDGIDKIDIKTDYVIKNFKYTPDGSYLVILSGDNKLYFYETSAGKAVYSINPPIQNNMLDFALYGNSVHILEIFENGEVYLIKLSELYQFKEKFPETGEPEKTLADTALSDKEIPSKAEEKITELEEITRIETTPLEEKNIDEDEEAVNKGHDQKNVYIGYKKSQDAFELRCGFNTTANKYFIGNLSFNAGYYFNRFLNPFYFGLDTSFGTAFPKKQFAYDYYLNGEKMHAPYLISIGFYLPLGFGIKPFKNDFRFTAELSPGIQIKRLWNGSFKQAVYGKFFAAPSAVMSVGFSYKWIGLQAGVNYDKIFNFSFMVQAVFRIEILEKKRSK